MPATANPSKITPRALAREWGVSHCKVLAWIKAGELRAINGATIQNIRPRYLIDQADVRAFEARRRVSPRG